jgi:ABC-type multidrug transport system permease subunit
MWVVAFPLLMTTFDSVAGGYGPERQQSSLLGFLLWDWSMAVLGAVTGFVASEAREGTLENVVLSPVAPLLTFSLRTLSAFLVLGAQTLVLGTVIASLLGIPLVVTGPSVVVLLLTLLGVGGISLALGGVALVFKSTESLVRVFSLLALVMTGAIVPLERLGVVFELLKVVVPTTWGIAALREAVIEGVGWMTLWHDGTWLGLGVQTAVFLLLGTVLVEFCLHKARVRGVLASY